MATVTIPIALGGTNTAYSDGTGANGMASSNGYGYNSLFIAMSQEVINACALAVQYATNLSPAVGDRTVSGNLGIGVSPGAWSGSSNVVQVGANFALENNAGAAGYSVYNGIRQSGVWKYLGTGAALLYGLETSGNYSWYTAPSGTAGNTISFTAVMTLNPLAGSTATASGAACSLVLGKDGTTSRTINAGGTVNASGADYAEYMRKAPACGVLVKGQICGIDVHGELTDLWDDAISFVVKSTDPSYVGGDVWGTEAALGMSRPVQPDTVTDLPQYEAELLLFNAALEAARQQVDRIAFAGQVPVNVVGAAPGQYIIPLRDGVGIGAVAKDLAELSLEEFGQAVGKVIAIGDDGRARIIVKVA
ncbi:hypothetical protein [Ramlibacter sp.]|uniref:hypothetical protein n=1 Tax=Ramlibacter sp. TaxID=1917967 RepID=UPI003D0D041C